MKTSRITIAALATFCLTASAPTAHATDTPVKFESVRLTDGGTAIRWSSPIDWRSVLVKESDPIVYARPTGSSNSTFLVLAEGVDARNIAREIVEFERSVLRPSIGPKDSVVEPELGKTRPDFRMVDDTRKNAQEKYARMKSKPGRPSEGPSAPGSRRPDTPRTPTGPLDDTPRGGARDCEDHGVFTFCPDFEVGEIPNDPEGLEGSLESLCEGNDPSWFCADLSPEDPVGAPEENVEDLCDREDLDPRLRELLCTVPELDDRLDPVSHPEIDDCSQGEAEQYVECDPDGKNCKLETHHLCKSKSGGADFFCIQKQESCEAQTNGEDIYFICADQGTIDCYHYGVD